jgi:phospholipase/lecithinase/hemolysin
MLAVALAKAQAQPIITSQPQSETNLAGATASFSVSAQGTSLLAYQWFFNSLFALAGATNGDLTLTNVQSSNSGGYSVIITNVEGAVTSVVATLTVLTPPRVTKQPINQTASLFADATFRVTAAGDAPLTYQWRFNDADLIGMTNLFLTVTNVQRTNAGIYKVVITNLSGSATSQATSLTITPFNSLYCFGFSWTDTQGLGVNGAPDGFNHNPLYWHNRASNGPMWPEYLSTNLGLAYNPANNYARGGASPQDILNQVINYPAPAKPQLSLYCFWRGKPDVTLSTATNQAALDQLLQASILINSNSVNRLYTKGAKVILFQHGIGDIYDFSGLTTNPVLNNVCLSNASDYSARFKVQFSNTMAGYTAARPDLRLLFFDGAPKWNEILNDPVRFGFTNTTVSALSDTNLVDKSFTGPGALYLNWDDGHATTKAHSLMAQWNLDILTNTILETLEATITNGPPTLRMNHLQIGRDYTLQTSVDLSRWHDVQTYTAAGGTNQWTAASVSATPVFYRLKWQP